MAKTAILMSMVLMVLLCAPASAMAEQTVAWKSKEALLRFTYEELELKGDERLGLAGGSYLIPVTPWLHTGIGVYGAVSGKRGGFFTGGVEASLKQPIAGGFSLGGGLFIGGGGGGAAPQGGGLMIRPHGELLYDTPFGTIGAGISHINFPNGDISSTQAVVTCQFPLDVTFAGGWAESLPDMEPSQLSASSSRGGRRYLLTYHHLYPEGNVKTTDGKSGDRSFGLLGADLQQRITEHVYLRAEAGGAVAGNADGYAQVLFGAGMEVPLGQRTALTGTLSAGAGGGGKIDTGGGFLAEGRMAIRHHFVDSWALGLSAGYLLAPDGSFKAGELGASLIYGPPAGESHSTPFNVGRWRVRGGVQSYIPSGTIRKSEADDDTAVDLVAIKIDRFLANGFYGTGQALAACDGNAGGYAAGLVGIGWQSPLAEQIPLFAMGELLLGAGGGGGIDSGSGFLLQPMIGLGMRLGSQVDMILSGGFVAAPDGRMATPAADLSLAWRFSTVESR
jgi:hypothetical protein